MRTRRVRAIATLLLTSAFFLVGPVDAARAGWCWGGPACERESISHVAKKTRSEKDDGVLDKIGLGSLEEIPWSTLPLALVLSVLVGAAGGFVYSGLIGPPDAAKKKSTSS